MFSKPLKGFPNEKREIFFIAVFNNPYYTYGGAYASYKIKSFIRKLILRNINPG